MKSIVATVMYLDSAEAKNITRSVISSGSANLPRGICESQWFNFASPASSRIMGVSTRPGQIELILMPYCEYSFALCLVSPSTPALDAV